MSERPHAYLQRFSGLSPRASIISATGRSCAASCAPEVGVAGGAEARDQEAHSHREEQHQWDSSRLGRVAEHAKEKRTNRRQQVADRLGHARMRSGVLGIGGAQREERER